MKATLKYILSFVLFSKTLWGIGQFQLGSYVGYTPEINQLNRFPNAEAGDNPDGTILWNSYPIYGVEELNNIINHTNSTGVATGKTLSYPWGVTFGVDLRYIWNSLFLRFACDYTWQLQETAGELTAGGFVNKISYNTWAFSLPVTIGFSHALAEFYQFYLGIGPYYGLSYLQVTHSAPNAFANLGPLSFPAQFLPPQKIELYGHVFGFHALLGLQFPVVPKKIYLSIDYLYMAGQSTPILVEGLDASGNPLANLYIPILQREERVILGVQYLVPL